MILDSGFNLTLSPLKYPRFYEMFKVGKENAWKVDDIDLSADIIHLGSKVMPHERYLLELVFAFFIRGKQIVADNLVENLYQRINSPEAKLYLIQQLFDEALHIQFYLTIVETYFPELEKQVDVLGLIEKIPSISTKSQFCLKWTNSIKDLKDLKNQDDRRKFLLNLIGYSVCVKGLFFSGAYAYICFLHTKGLLPGLVAGTQRILRDEVKHFRFSFELIETIRKEDPTIFSEHLNELVVQMIEDAIECEMGFFEDVFEQEIEGLSLREMRQYLEFVADQKLKTLSMPLRYYVKNPFAFVDWSNDLGFPTFTKGKDFQNKSQSNNLYLFNETL